MKQIDKQIADTIAVFVAVVISLTLFAFVMNATADTVYCNQCEVAFDPVIDAESYNIYIQKINGEGALLANTTDTTFTIILTEEGEYLVGVSSMYHESESATAWSNVPENCKDGAVFTIGYFMAKEMPTGIWIVR